MGGSRKRRVDHRITDGKESEIGCSGHRANDDHGVGRDQQAGSSDGLTQESSSVGDDALSTRVPLRKQIEQLRDPDPVVPGFQGPEDRRN
jgi:hypothetical protein